MTSFLKKFILGIISALFLLSSVSADQKANDGWDDQKGRLSISTQINIEDSSNRIGNGIFDVNSLIKTNLSCGLAPLAPLGCRNPTCVCDQNGRNCQWVFQCG